MFFLTRRRVRALPRVGLLGWGISVSLSLLRRGRLAAAGDAHALRALAGSGVGLGPLAVHGEAAPVAKSSIGADLRQSLDVLGALPAEVALHLARLDGLSELHDLVVGQVLDVGVRIDARVLDDLLRRRGADAVNVGQAHLDTLVGGNVDAGDTSHCLTPASACDVGWSRSRARRRAAELLGSAHTSALRMLVPSPSTRWVVSNQFRRRPVSPMNRARRHKKMAFRPAENGSRGVPAQPGTKRGDLRPKRATYLAAATDAAGTRNATAAAPPAIARPMREGASSFPHGCTTLISSLACAFHPCP